MKLITRGAMLRILVFIGALAFAGGSVWWTMIRMPGTSYLDPLPNGIYLSQKYSISGTNA